MSPAVVVVGSYVQDLTWRCARFPVRGETVVGDFAAGPGGKGSNQAVAAARAGARVCFVGAVGRDVFARAASDFYQREKIAACFVGKRGLATGTAAILVNAAGENEIIVSLGANLALAPADVNRRLFKRAQVVVTQHESNLATTAHVLRLAQGFGAITVHNPAPMRDDFDPTLLSAVDVLIPNEHEFLALLNRRSRHKVSENALRRMRDADMHAYCRALGVPTVIVTLGARGCFISQPEAGTRLAGHTGIRVVDTTGAGDAFVGGFAAGIVRFAGDVVRAARFANVVAALSVTRPGTAPAMPHAGEIERFARRRNLAL